MTYKMTILGSGAAPGVPAIAIGWGACDPNNPKNCRTRTTVCLEYHKTRILIDTSPDLRTQLLKAHINTLSGVLYTHPHADHLHGIDDLREINRITSRSLNFYASPDTLRGIKQRFPYLLATPKHLNNVSTHPSLIANEINYYEPFYIDDLKITPIRLMGHMMPSTGYIFNDGDIVYIADYRKIEERAFEMIKKPVKLMVVPLTLPEGSEFHAGLDDILSDIKRVHPQKAVINHMAAECDYEAIFNITPANVEPAYDNMEIDLD
ncbi:MAG: MBL fold metallo-hydrolase [Alphaproteobacteria bacterium]|nr:MBL fold metallo-hydrolase [Alphaproteobacteria bacterium]